MTISSTLQALGIDEDTELGHAGSLINDRIKEYIQHSQEYPSEASAKKEEKALEKLYALFFDFAREWVLKEREKYQHSSIKNHPNAQELQLKARNSMDEMKRVMAHFGLTYMRLGRSKGFIMRELENLPERQKQNMRWSADSDKSVRRMINEILGLTNDNKRFAKALIAIRKASDDWTAMENAAEQVFGNTDDALRPFRASLRSGDAERARASLEKLVARKGKFSLKGSSDEARKILGETGKKLLKVYQDNKEDLMSSEDKLFVSEKELTTVIQNNMREIEHKKSYLKKYLEPFIEDKAKRVDHLKDKLFVVGSVEGLTTLYIRMMRGLAQPLEDIKDVRLYESEVLQNVEYLTSGQLKEIDVVDERNQELLEDFYKTLGGFEKVLEQALIKR